MILLKGERAEKLIQLGAGIETDDGLLLHEYELAYFVEKGIVNYEKSAEELIAGKVEKYLVYKDLRDKGYILRLSKEGDFFRVYRKGFRRGEDRTMYLLKVIPKEKTLTPGEILEDLIISSRMRKDLIYAIVGETIQYVKVGKHNFQ